MPQARNNSDTAPLVLWLTGGPGCSSELAVFVENGPYMLNDKGEVEERKYAWDVEVSPEKSVRCVKILKTSQLTLVTSPVKKK